MKKQIKKLSLNKKTISNLTAVEMSKHFGGSLRTTGCHGGGGGGSWVCGKTGNGNTCYGHNTCYNC